MDKISADLLDRIRTAVIKKLREMERYVDNELPDYIMILVANKRTLAHMQKDLALFLGKHTTDFTLWLFEMITHLKKSSSSVNASLKSERTNEDIEKNNSEEDADVLDYDLGDQEGDLLYQDDNSQSSKPSVSGDTLKAKVRDSTVKTVKPIRIEDAFCALNRQNTTQKSAKVFPVQPICRLPTKSNVLPEEQQPTYQSAFLDEYDPTKPEFTSGMSSIVRNTRKSYSKPPALQTNKLLLRAVNDATKSIIENKNMNRYKPTPIKVLASTKHENFGSRSHNLVNVKIDSSLNLDTIPAQNVSSTPTSYTNEPEPKLNVFESDDYDFLVAENNNRTIFLPSEQSELETDNPFPMNEYSADNSDSPFPMTEYSEDNTDTPFPMNESSADNTDTPLHVNENSAVKVEQEDEQTAPHFIVTLDGVHFPSLKRKFSDSEESMDVEDSFLDEEDFDSSQKRQKVVEKCKYWPSCKNNDDCVYYHPNVPCKSFPDCRYGDKCLYIHPKCKFDAHCSRKDCPYTHASKKKFPLPVVASMRPAKVRGFKTVCKFYPKCTVKNCAFIHPKLCRFGTKCRLPTCLFTHVSIPPRKQMKWKANVAEDIM